MQLTVEKSVFKINGFAALSGLIFLLLASLLLLALQQFILGTLALLFVFIIGFPGLYTVQPNEARVLTFFGSYTGIIKDQGFWWSNPLAIKRKISLRVRNFNSEQLKVNDADGNPIEIAAVVVWKVINPAAAIFDVDDYQAFVEIQSETAIRALSSQYPYDNHNESGISLRANPNEVAESLLLELEDRLQDAGVKVLEARISHLAYAQEIAQAMLRRQQAQAIIAARKQIVEGAVGMVQMALHQLSEKNIVQLDDERKAIMVNNLLVALVSEQDAQPIINTGSLY